MAAARPTQPPTGADMSALVKRVHELSQKVLGKDLPKGALEGLPRWKRWVGGEAPEYDATGLRDVVNTNAVYLDDVKNDLDQHRTADNARHAVVRQDITELRAAIEALSGGPFPG